MIKCRTNPYAGKVTDPPPNPALYKFSMSPKQDQQEHSTSLPLQYESGTRPARVWHESSTAEAMNHPYALLRHKHIDSNTAKSIYRGLVLQLNRLGNLKNKCYAMRFWEGDPID